MVTQPAGSLADTGTRGAPKFSKFWLGIAYSLYDAGHIRWFLYLSNPYLDGTRVIAHSGTTFPGTHIKTCDQKILLRDYYTCLLYTSDAADDLLCVDLGGRRIIKKKKKT